MRRSPILRKNGYLVMPRKPLPKHKDPKLSALDFVLLYLLGDDGMEDSHSTTLDNIAMLNYFRRRRCPCPGPRRICAAGSGI